MNAHLNEYDIENAGWVRNQTDWYFYSSRGRETQLHFKWETGASVPIEAITLRVNGQYVGKVFNGHTGLLDLSLLEGKIDRFTSLEFAKAMKPLL